MKKATLIFFFICIKLLSQNVYSVNKFNISFETNETLKVVATESEDVISFKNNNVGIDIEAFSIEQESKQFLTNLKYGAESIAKDFGLIDIVDGGKLQKITNGYYIKAFGFENDKKYPVFIIAAYDYDIGIAYEISIDAYNLNETESLLIINSFKIIE